MVNLPQPEKIRGHEGHFSVQYGPDVLREKAAFAQGIGLTIAYIAEAERHLETILKTLIGGDTRVITVLLASFRGHKQLLASVTAALESTGRSEDLDTFQTIKVPIAEIWKIRDSFGHGIWAKSTAHPNAALRVSARTLGGVEESARWLLAEGKFNEAFQAYDDVTAEVWTDADFSQATLAAQGAVNSLMAFSACIARSPVEAAPLHTALRSQGLLSTPPWKLQTPIPPQENPDTL